jgi:hypothetical protein
MNILYRDEISARLNRESRFPHGNRSHVLRRLLGEYGPNKKISMNFRRLDFWIAAAPQAESRGGTMPSLES